MKASDLFRICLIGFISLLLGSGLSGCQMTPALEENILTLEEYLLEGPPDTDRGIFLPIGTTQDAVLSKHQTERERYVYNELFYSEQEQSIMMISQGSGRSLTAIMENSLDDPLRQIVEVRGVDDVIFSVDGGLPSPALPLQSLWSFDDHWVLEILFAEEEIWQGRIYLDGELLNESLDYEDAFGFQLLQEKSFYFFQRQDMLWYSYDGKETILPYDQIPHYNCCSASTLNPLPSENMVAFYGLIGDEWYYVELGAFSSD